MKLEWSVAALADLDRFAEFLHDHHPHLAPIIASEIMERVRIIAEHPQLGRPIAGRLMYSAMPITATASSCCGFSIDGSSARSERLALAATSKRLMQDFTGILSER